jgi:predicted Zn-dependent protease
MKYSENAHYRDYVRRREAKDYIGAIESLRACINDLRGDEYEAMFRADLLQRIGDLQLSLGQQDAAFASHEHALKTDPTSLLVKLHFARFLASAGERARAIEECDRIVKTAEETPFAESQEDFGSDYYVREAQKLKESFLQRDQGREAGESGQG